MKKTISVILSGILLIGTAGWVCLQYIYIPNILVPLAAERIESYFPAGASADIKRIRYIPPAGFIMEGIDIHNKSGTIFTAYLIRIKLSPHLLIRRQITIKEIDLQNCLISFTRSTGKKQISLSLSAIIEFFCFSGQSGFRGRIYTRRLSGIDISGTFQKGNGNNPLWKIKIDAKNTALNGTGMLYGKLDLSAGITGKGNNPSQIKGGGTFFIRDALLWDIPLLYGAKGSTTEAAHARKPQYFDTIEGEFGIDKGTLNIRRIYARSKIMDIWIQGKVSFSGETDLSAAVKLKRKGIMGILSIPAADIARECVNIEITGSISRPKIRKRIRPIGWFSSFARKIGRSHFPFSLKKILNAE